MIATKCEFYVHVKLGWESILIGSFFMSNIKINNMETRNVTIILEKAREWFYSEDASLKEIALQAFNREH